MLQLHIRHFEQSCLFELSGEEGQRLEAQTPFPLTVIDLYQQWRIAYINFYQNQPHLSLEETDNNFRGRKGGSGMIASLTTDWKGCLVNAETQLLYEFNQWLRNQQLFDIRAKIAGVCRQQSPQESVDLFLSCSTTELAKLPWESWEISNDFAIFDPPKIIRIPSQRKSAPAPTVERSRPRILAIIGQDSNQDFQQDLVALQSKLKPVAIVEAVGWKPGKSTAKLETDIKQAITDESGWDVLFFAGHSNETQMTGGELGIAPGEFLQISEIAYQLEIAKNRGLQFALFNSCNGLKIAESLIDLGLSQVAVMREPIHNRVAQEFLLQFLQNLAAYKNVQESLIAACKFLKVDKSFTYPSAHLIPSLFRYPNTQCFHLKPSGWREFFKQIFKPKWYEVAALVTLSILSWQLSVQYHLLDQRVKTQAAYRNLTRQVPQTDPSLLLVKIDDESLTDIGFPDPLISRKYLAQLIDHAALLNYDVVGIDYALKTVEPEEDPVLEASLNSARNNSDSSYIFATTRNQQDKRLWTLPKFAEREWQGDIRLWRKGRYATLLPLTKEERPLPLSYLLALTYQAGKVETDLQQQNPAQLTHYLSANWMYPSPLSIAAYGLYQFWLHPIVDFSIPSERVYRSISAQKFLNTPPERLQQQYQQPMMMIIPGGYSNAGLNQSGEDNLPAPPGFCYWQQRQNPRQTCQVLLGGEVHAYLFHHFLKQKPIMPIPDLWMLWLFALAGKVTAVSLAQHKPTLKKVLYFLIGGTLIYGLIGLQLYVSALILLPILIPVIIVWIYILPTLIRRPIAKQ
ncbi:MAG: CHASE2 domain-containing protein [Microcoleaceae cyanobacterium]